MIAVGLRHKLVTLQRPVVTQESGNLGGYTETWTNLSPATTFAAIRVGQGSTENVTASVERAQVTHTLEIPYHQELTLKCRVVMDGRTLYVRGLENVDERNHTHIVTAEERA